MVPWAHPGQLAKPHLDRFSRFDEQADTCRPRYYVCSNRLHLAINAMRPNSNNSNNGNK